MTCGLRPSTACTTGGRPAAGAADDSCAAVTAGDTRSLVGRYAAGRRAESAGAPLLRRRARALRSDEAGVVASALCEP